MNAEISVIVPVYNVEEYIDKCIKSILNQTFSNYELILVDDGSTDSSGRLCDEAKNKDGRVKVIHKKNGGLTSARLAGREIATGRYTLFIDSDDYIESTMLEKLYNSAIDNAADLVICGYYVVEDDRISEVRLPISGLIENENIREQYLLPILGRIHYPGRCNLPGFVCIRLYSSALLEDKCFVSERLFYSEDDILNMQYALNIKKISVVDEPLYYYVQRVSSLTYQYRKNMWEMSQRRYEYCKKFARDNHLFEMDPQRIYFNGLSGIMKSIDNIIQSVDFAESKKLFQEISSSSVEKEVLKNIRFSLLGQSQKVVYICLKFKLWGMLYCFRRSRFRRK